MVEKLDTRHGDVDTEEVKDSLAGSVGQWTLMWWKFRKHKPAVWAGRILILLYIVAFFSGFFAPYDVEKFDLYKIFQPPQPIHFIDETGFSLRPFVYKLDRMRDPATGKVVYQPNKSKREYLKFFVYGEKYYVWGFIPASMHLFGTENGNTKIHLLGTDSYGRDFLSCLIRGTTISLSIGLIGVIFSVIIGIVMGTISGFYGGKIDNAIQRLIEFINAFPKLPIWMALAAALPASLSSIQVYFGITVILSMIGWTRLARVVRGKILALREEDYAMAAELSGCSDRRIMFVHLLPGFASHMIVSVSMSIPMMIAGETSLSFLGVGLKAPTVSWGLMLNDALDFSRIINTPWVLMPMLCVIVTVFSFNFLGDGLRDAAEPYGK